MGNRIISILLVITGILLMGHFLNRHYKFTDPVIPVIEKHISIIDVKYVAVEASIGSNPKYHTIIETEDDFFVISGMKSISLTEKAYIKRKGYYRYLCFNNKEYSIRE